MCLSIWNRRARELNIEFMMRSASTAIPRIRIWVIDPEMPGRSIDELLTYAQYGSLDATVRDLPSGAYTTFRTFQHNLALHLDEHLSRLEETARVSNFEAHLDRPKLRRAIRHILNNYSQNQNVKIRIVLDLEKKPGMLFLVVEQFTPISDNLYLSGVKAITVPAYRNNPQAKQTQSISIAQNVRAKLPVDVHEALLMDEKGAILEGTSSNFFAVMKNVICTADQGILSGITRKILLEEIRLHNLPLRLHPITLQDLPEVVEGFISSSSRGVLPICQINQQIIGDGMPGQICKQLTKYYEEHLTNNLERI